MKKTLLFGASFAVMLAVGVSSAGAVDMPDSNVNITTPNTVTPLNFVGDNILTLTGTANALTISGDITANTSGHGTVQDVSSTSVTQGGYDIGVDESNKIGSIVVNGDWDTSSSSIYAGSMDVHGTFTATDSLVNVQCGPRDNDLVVDGSLILSDTEVVTNSGVLTEAGAVVNMTGDSTISEGLVVDGYTNLYLRDSSVIGGIIIGDSDVLDVYMDNSATLGAIDGVVAGQGTVSFKESFNLDNTVGATNSLAEIEVVDGATVHINGQEIVATLIDVDGHMKVDTTITGDVNIQGGILDVKDGGCVNGPVDGYGHLNFYTSTALCGQVGSLDPIEMLYVDVDDVVTTGGYDITSEGIQLEGELDVNNPSSTVTATNPIDVNGGLILRSGVVNADLDIDGGEFDFHGGVLNGAIDGAGTARFYSSFSPNSAIGGTSSLNLVEIVGDSTVLTATDEIFATAVNFDGDGSLVIVNDDVNAGVTTSANGTGNVDFTGTGVLFGSIGASGAGLNTVTYDGVNDFGVTPTIYANNVNITNGSEVKLTEDTNFTVGTTTVDGVSTLDLEDLTLTTTGDFDISGASTLKTEINSSSNLGNLVIGGVATIDSDTQVEIDFDDVYEESLVQGGEYIIADGASGAGVATLVSDAIDDSILFKMTQKADLEDLVYISEADIHLDDVTAGTHAAPAGSQLQADIESASLSSGLRGVMENIQPMTEAQQLEAVKDLLPESNGARVVTVFDGLKTIDSVIKSRLKGVSSGDDVFDSYGVWGDATIGAATQDSRDGYDGYDLDRYGVALGFDKDVSENGEAGIAVSYMNADVDFKDSSSGNSTNIDTYSLIGYGSYDFPEVTLEAQASFGYSDYNSVRDLTYSGAGYASGDYDGYIYGLAANLIKEYELNNGISLTPMLGLKYKYISLDSYVETGSPAALEVDGENYNSLSSVLGLQAEFPLNNTEKKWSMTPSVHGYWSHEFIDDSYDVTSKFVGGSSSFTTIGVEPESDTFNIGADLELTNNNNWEVSLSYNAEIKDEYLGHVGELRIRKDF